jgi:hypothetical protein
VNHHAKELFPLLLAKIKSEDRRPGFLCLFLVTVPCNSQAASVAWFLCKKRDDFVVVFWWIYKRGKYGKCMRGNIVLVSVRS